MQTVVNQYYGVRRFGIAGVSNKFRWFDQRLVVDQQLPVVDIIAAHIGVTGAFDGECFVKKHTGTGYDSCASSALETARWGYATHGIRAVETIIKAAPPRICSVKGVAGVCDRHDQLRTRDRRNFRIDIRCIDLKIIAFVQKVANIFQERLIGCMIMGVVAVGYMPIVDLLLQRLAFGQKISVFRSQLMGEVGQSGPKLIGRNFKPVQSIIFDKVD